MNLKAIKIKAIATFMVLLMAFFVANFVFAADDGLTAAQKGLETSAKTNFVTGSSAKTMSQMVSSVIKVALSLLGVVFVVLMIYGGFVWMMARGDEGQVVKAKDLISAAVIGLVIVVSAYMITWFVVYNASFGTLAN